MLSLKTPRSNNGGRGSASVHSCTSIVNVQLFATQRPTALSPFKKGRGLDHYRLGFNAGMLVDVHQDLVVTCASVPVKKSSPRRCAERLDGPSIVPSPTNLGCQILGIGGAESQAGLTVLNDIRQGSDGRG